MHSEDSEHDEIHRHGRVLHLQAGTVGDMSQAPAGWYPDCYDDTSEVWWDGTSWTANSRPLNHAPAQAPQPPAPAAVTQPGAGWYTNPQNSAEEMWFDGTAWTQFTRQRAGQPPAGGPGLPGLLGSISGQIQQGARDPRGFYREHRQGVDAAAGGAMLIDGLVGLPTRRGNRSGVFGSLVGIVVGLVFVGVGIFMSSALKTPANMSATVTGKVTGITVSQGTPSSSNSSQRSSPTCRPEAAFEVGGKPYTASTSIGVSPCPWTMGQPIVVAYDPASPALNTIPSKGGVTWMPWIFGGAGALVAVVSLFSFIRSVAELGAGGFLLLRMWRRRKAATSPA